MITGTKTVARPSSILIVNGMITVRKAVASWINRSVDLRVCGEVLGQKEALEQVKRLRPNLVLTEIMEAQDLDFIRELHRCHRRLPIVAFSFREEEAFARLALEAGARCYLMTNVHGSTVVDCIRQVLKERIALR